VSLLGLAGEIGTLLAGYKKYLRDGTAYELFPDNVEEELGDILWYIANAAAKFNLPLERIAESNIAKVTDRWPSHQGNARPTRTAEEHFDSLCLPEEQLPREFEIEIRPVTELDSPEPKIQVIWKGEVVGDALGDNTYDDSGYRFHDVFHLANAAVLGWSPVARGKLFNCKRQSDTRLDSVEDGGRAIVVEEGIAAYVFEYGRQHNNLKDVTSLDFQVLRTFRTLTSGLEVQARPLWEVEEAIFQGFAAWRQIKNAGGGLLRGNLADRRLVYVKASDAA
jgi:NTP pyrophosphatase (non-canonical NTP hydrolase)